MLSILNERIKELRVLHGYNQVEFARLVGVTKQCVSNWENDNVIPSIEMLVKIADIFHVTTDFMLGKNEEIHINVSGLTAEQISHLSMIVEDLKKSNAK